MAEIKAPVFLARWGTGQTTSPVYGGRDTSVGGVTAPTNMPVIGDFEDGYVSSSSTNGRFLMYPFSGVSMSGTVTLAGGPPPYVGFTIDDVPVSAMQHFCSFLDKDGFLLYSLFIAMQYVIAFGGSVFLAVYNHMTGETKHYGGSGPTFQFGSGMASTLTTWGYFCTVTNGHMTSLSVYPMEYTSVFRGNTNNLNYSHYYVAFHHSVQDPETANQYYQDALVRGGVTAEYAETHQVNSYLGQYVLPTEFSYNLDLDLTASWQGDIVLTDPIIRGGFSLDQGIFMKGFLTAKALQLHQTSAGAGVSGANSGGPFDKKSFLAGMAAGFCAEGCAFGAGYDAAHPKYQYITKFEKTLIGPAINIFNEYGLRLEYNEGAAIAKCGIYITQQSDTDGNTWDFLTIACTGVGISSATLVPFYSWNGVVTLDGMTEGSGVETVSLEKDENGVWSKGAAYEILRMNIVDGSGSPVKPTGYGMSGTNATLFTNLGIMKAWLNA